MTQHSKSRQQAESAFAGVQSQFLARNRATEERDAVTQAREAKTSRLRKARLAKELEDRAGLSADLSENQQKA